MEKIDLKKVANPREQALALLVLLALFIMFFRVIYFPKKVATQQIKTQIQGLKLEKEALEKFTQALRQAVPKEGELFKEPPSKKMQVLKGELTPIAKETSSLLALLASQSFLKGIVVKGMSDLPPKKEAGYQKADFFINAEGSFRNMTNYLERMEKLPALLVLEDIALKALDPKAAQVDLELNGTLFGLEERHASP